MFQSNEDEKRLGQHLFFAAEILKKKMHWGKAKIQKFVFSPRKTELLAAMAPGVSLGSLAGHRAAEGLPSCSGQTCKTHLLQQSSLKQRMPGIPSMPQAGSKCLWQPRKLQLLGCISCCGSPETPQQSLLSQVRHSGYLPQSWEHSSSSDLNLLCRRESGNPGVPGSRTACSQQGWDSRLNSEMSILHKPIWQFPTELWAGIRRNVSNSFPTFFWENSLASEKSVWRDIIFFSTTSVSQGTQGLHHFTVHVFAQRKTHKVQSCFM